MPVRRHLSSPNAQWHRRLPRRAPPVAGSGAAFSDEHGEFEHLLAWRPAARAAALCGVLFVRSVCAHQLAALSQELRLRLACRQQWSRGMLDIHQISTGRGNGAPGFSGRHDDAFDAGAETVKLPMGPAVRCHPHRRRLIARYIERTMSPAPRTRLCRAHPLPRRSHRSVRRRPRARRAVRQANGITEVGIVPHRHAHR